MHQVANGETLADVVLRVELAPRVERVGSPRDDRGRQRDVGGDHEVPRLHLLHDPVIGHVRALRHPHGADEVGRRDAQGAVGDQRGQDLHPLGGPVQDLLDDLGARVGVYPDPHAIPPGVTRG